MKNMIAIALASVFLTACATYSDALEQKLAGKSLEQKRIILAQECRQEIMAGLKPDNPQNVRHFERTRKICEEMTGKKIKTTN